MEDFGGETMTTYTGEKNYHDSGRTATRNNATNLPYWEPPCGRIEGSTDGKKFGNDILPNETLSFYRRFLCRPMPLVGSIIKLLIGYLPIVD